MPTAPVARPRARVICLPTFPPAEQHDPQHASDLLALVALVLFGACAFVWLAVLQ